MNFGRLQIFSSPKFGQGSAFLGNQPIQRQLLSFASYLCSWSSACMDFSVVSRQQKPVPSGLQRVVRRGVLTLRRNGGCKSVTETPGCFLYSQLGSIPHLTPDDLQYIKNLPENLTLNMNLSTVAALAEPVSDYGKGLSGFVGFPEALVYISMHDVLSPPKHGTNDRNSVGLWSRAGRMKVTPDGFLDLSSKLRPDLVQIICDMDTEFKGASGQRLTKSYESTLRWLDYCLEQLEKTPNQVPVLATVGGGSDEWRRTHFCSEVALRKVDGFVIDGFGNNWLSRFKEWESSTDIFGEHKELVQQSLNLLPENKPRFLHAPLPPEAVVCLVEMGVDVFDSSYPAALADRGEALVRVSETEFEVLILSDRKYFEDLSGISSRCDCYSCTKYTKAYVHHLLSCREINAGVLLMIHNLNEYLKFFKDLRASIEEGTIIKWKSKPVDHHNSNVSAETVLA